MGSYFVKIRTSRLDLLQELQQVYDLDVFRHTARQLAEDLFEVDALVSNSDIEKLKKVGYQVELIADASKLAEERQKEISDY
ncbi:MAG: hypothetical protein JNN15_05105 [Blastocatellia bacterium]|nr:hypothetical protein [Blastocatellia bacterium]